MSGTETMRDLIASFPSQLTEALKLDLSSVKDFIGKKDPLIQDVTFCGMGGSGIAGILIRSLFEGDSVYPLITHHAYAIPEYRNSESLVIISSYSGNTEEALSMLRAARSAQVVCVTSGGKLAQLAREKGYASVIIPDGLPPRAALAYSMIAQASVLECFEIIDSGFRKETEMAVSLIDSMEDSMQQEATEMAEHLAGKITAIYTGSELEAVAIRFRQQLAENAKQLAWHHVVPEMNHNELVGWRNEHKDIAAVFLRLDYEHERTKLRMQFTKELIRKKAGFVGELRAKGESRLAQSLYLIHLVDWVSQRVGERMGVDTMEVKEIDDLKSFLSSQ